MFACSLLAVLALLPLLWQPGCFVFGECFLHTASEGGGVDLIKCSKTFLYSILNKSEWDANCENTSVQQCAGEGRTTLTRGLFVLLVVCSPLVWRHRTGTVWVEPGRILFSWRQCISSSKVSQPSCLAFRLRPFCAVLEWQGKKPEASNPCLQPLPAATLMLGTGS